MVLGVVFLSRSQRLVSFLSFCVVVGGNGFQTQKRKSWAIFVPRQVSGRGGDADGATLTSLRGCRGSAAEIQELRVLVEQLRMQQRVEKEQGVQGDTTRRESGLEEDWNMGVDEEVDKKKKLDEQWKRLQKQLREIYKFSDMGEMFWDGQKEKWKEELQEIEEKRNQLLPEHPKHSENVSKDAKFGKHLKDACACDEEMRKVRDEIDESEARFLGRRSRATVGWQQMIWKKKSRACKQGKKEEAAVLHSPRVAAWTRLWISFSLACKASKPCTKNSSEGSWQEEKGEEEKCIMQPGATKVLRTQSSHPQHLLDAPEETQRQCCICRVWSAGERVRRSRKYRIRKW